MRDCFLESIELIPIWSTRKRRQPLGKTDDRNQAEQQAEGETCRRIGVSAFRNRGVREVLSFFFHRPFTPTPASADRSLPMPIRRYAHPSLPQFDSGTTRTYIRLIIRAYAMLRLLFLGDIIGEPGRKAVIEMVPRLRQWWGIDFIIVNGENAAAGRGITGRITIDLLRAGIAVITTGDHVWDQKEVNSFIETEPRLLRPINYPVGTPGKGSIVLETAKGKVGVINVQGRTFMQPSLENPFRSIEEEVSRMRAETHLIFVDVHAETTSEKIALGRFLDGKVSVVAGTHTHVQTADEQIFPGGTAFICDAGMCGPDESVLGREILPIIQRFMTSMPANFPVAKGGVTIHGILVDIDTVTGHAKSIRRVAEPHAPEVVAPADGS